MLSTDMTILENKVSDLENDVYTLKEKHHELELFVENLEASLEQLLELIQGQK
jgi:predicted nuclease with TOPRIM domain